MYQSFNSSQVNENAKIGNVGNTTFNDIPYLDIGNYLFTLAATSFRCPFGKYDSILGRIAFDDLQIDLGSHVIGDYPVALIFTRRDIVLQQMR